MGPEFYTVEGTVQAFSLMAVMDTGQEVHAQLT